MKTYIVKYTSARFIGFKTKKIKANSRFSAKMEMTELDPFASNIRIIGGVEK